MNDFEIEMGKILFEYQMSKGGKGDAHPREIIKALGSIRDSMIMDYGANGCYAKPCKHCDSGSYYCDCRK